MSNVPKGRRKKHDFVANHNLVKLRKVITELAINDFGYDKERYEKQINNYEERHDNPYKDEIVAKMRAKNESYYTDFVEEETRITREIMRNAVKEFEIGNSIFPSGDSRLEEYHARRLHFDEAIGYLNVLIQELQYIADILPCDKNKYDNLEDEIEHEINLIKGVRRAANKFLEQPK
ncbi:MAG: hypothetical protein K6G84_07565 [Lachnospiraceae bacterium]|nr:hypothetical protein [Lachnospiraceae bacterium]